MTMEKISEAHEKELQLAQQDRAVELTKEKKNTLESYVYETRSKVLVKNINKTQLTNFFDS